MCMSHTRHINKARCNLHFIYVQKTLHRPQQKNLHTCHLLVAQWNTPPRYVTLRNGGHQGSSSGSIGGSIWITELRVS